MSLREISICLVHGGSVCFLESMIVQCASVKSMMLECAPRDSMLVQCVSRESMMFNVLPLSL